MNKQQLTELQNDAYRAETERMKVVFDARAERRRNWQRFVLCLIPLLTPSAVGSFVAFSLIDPKDQVTTVSRACAPDLIVLQPASNAADYDKNHL